MLRRGSLAVMLALASGAEAGDPSLPRVASNCVVCRGVVQGFLDLFTEWPLVRQIEMARSSRDDRLGDEACRDDSMPFTYDEAVERFCKQTFLTGNQQRVCYSIVPFAAEVAQWLRMGVPPDRVCRKLGSRNPDTCFDAREAERPDEAELLDSRNRPHSIPQGVECLIEHRSSVAPRWVLLD